LLKRMKRLYHATDVESACEIMKNGFEINFNSNYARIGNGVYFFERKNRDDLDEFGNVVIEVDLEYGDDDSWLKEADKYSNLGVIYEEKEELIESDIGDFFEADNYDDLVKEYRAVARSIREEKLKKGVKVAWMKPSNYGTEYVFYDVVFLNSMPRRIVDRPERCRNI
jgi:hypothetical protein